jgi:hypothetical protein
MSNCWNTQAPATRGLLPLFLFWPSNVTWVASGGRMFSRKFATARERSHVNSLALMGQVISHGLKRHDGVWN